MEPCVHVVRICTMVFVAHVLVWVWSGFFDVFGNGRIVRVERLARILCAVGTLRFTLVATHTLVLCDTTSVMTR